MKELITSGGGAVFWIGFALAVVNRKLLEISKDGKGHVSVPGVTAQLVGRVDVVLDIDGRLLGFDEELALATHAEGVIGGFGGAFNLEGILDEHLAILGSIAIFVVDVPPEGFKEFIEECLAEAGFIVFTGAVGFAILFEIGDELVDDLRCGHGFSDGGKPINELEVRPSHKKCSGAQYFRETPLRNHLI